VNNYGPELTKTNDRLKSLTLSHNIAPSTSRLSGIRPYNVSGDIY